MIKNFAIVGSAKRTIHTGDEYSILSKCLQGFGMVETSIEESDGLIFINYRRYMHLVQFFNKIYPLCSDESRLAGGRDCRRKILGDFLA